ncbi:S24 family peptidase [Polaromonas sp.]|uniref:LexA family protein n=1 Tax=Polaromonas sp. TaxID=1869339 RepID=UPI003265EEB9
MGKANTDHQHLLKLRDLYAVDRALPSSLARMAEVLGFSSANAALKLCDRLCLAGVLRKGPDGKVLPTDRFFALPVMETSVRAGTPDAVEPQSWSDAMTLDSFLIRRPSKTVLLKVKGDSMRDAGILDGDLAIIERTKQAREGQFVVAFVDGAYTLKELRYEGKRPVLIPHNPEHKPIRPQLDLEIYGVFRGLARSHWPTNAQGRSTS